MSKATIKTAKGDMVVEFFDADAPNTVANFRKLADRGIVIREWKVDRDTGHLDPAELDKKIAEL